MNTKKAFIPDNRLMELSLRYSVMAVLPGEDRGSQWIVSKPFGKMFLSYLRNICVMTAKLSFRTHVRNLEVLLFLAGQFF